MAKFSFDNSIGELFDSPEVRAIFEELFPGELENPLIGSASVVIFRDALGYIDGDDAFPKEKIELFEKRLSEL